MRRSGWQSLQRADAIGEPEDDHAVENIGSGGLTAGGSDFGRPGVACPFKGVGQPPLAAARTRSDGKRGSARKRKRTRANPGTPGSHSSESMVARALS